ncbi:MAG: 6-phosphogluconolactonase [Rhizobiaceae bacterium]|nr:6-phosphogluconolactonase [Rhizobiaceae bacterium]
MAEPVLHQFASRQDLARALAEAVSGRLAAAIERTSSALLAVSGGSTPGPFFDVLSCTDIDWPKVTVTLVDERLVPDTSPRSNAGLVRARLLQDRASAAAFLPLFGTGDVAADAAATEARLRALGRPIDVVVLGMGNDGHTASFFPDADELDALVDPAAQRLVAGVHAASAGEPRLTLTLPPLLDAGFIALHIEGAEKHATLERVLAPGSRLPIRRVMDAVDRPVEVYWAP